MLRGDLIVFDEYVFGPVAATPVYTPAVHNSVLATNDRLAIFAVVDQATALGHLNVNLEHSADGRLWIVKSPSALEINALFNDFPASSQKAMWGYTSGSTPTLAEARLKIYFTESSINAHVRIHVTMRDPHY